MGRRDSITNAKIKQNKKEKQVTKRTRRESDYEYYKVSQEKIKNVPIDKLYNLRDEKFKLKELMKMYHNEKNSN